MKLYIFLLLTCFGCLAFANYPKKERALDLVEGQDVSANNPTSKVEHHYQEALRLRDTDIKSALDHAEKGGDLAARSGLYNLAFRCYFLAGTLYKEKRNIFQSKSTLMAFEKAAINAERSGNKTNLMSAYKQLAEEYAAVKQSQMALEYYKKYTDLQEDKIQLKAQQLSQTLHETQQDVKNMDVQINSLETQNKEAYVMLDSVSKEKLMGDLELSRKELDNETMKLELSNERNKRNMLLGGIIGIILILGFISFALFQSRKSKNILATKNVVIEQAKAKSDELLLNILPKPVANELKEKGKTTPRFYENVTVLFTDFKSFTMVSEKLTPIELVHEIDFYFRGFDEIIAKYNIEKIKTIGDAYLCVSGLPEPNPNNCEEILMAALEIRHFMANMAKEREKSKKPFFTMRMGVHTGPLVAGVVGSTKFVYDVWGDTVNVAARMEQNGVEGKINVSEDVYKRANKKFTFTSRGMIEAKNKGSLNMYFLEEKDS